MQSQPVSFSREPDDHITLPGADVTFVCSVAIPNGFSYITWLYNNTIIKPGPHYIISSENQNTSKLSIKNISTEDQGDYHCFVRDWKTKVRSRSGQLHGKKLNTNVNVGLM